LSNPKCEAAQHFRRFMSRLGLVTAAVSFIACAPDRSQWMARAAKNQATLATEDIGTVDQVRHGAKQEATFLTAMESAIYGNADKYAPQERAAYLALAQDDAEIASGLEAIADSQTDAGFTNAVFAMCEPLRKEAEPRVGRAELVLAEALRMEKYQAPGSSVTAPVRCSPHSVTQ